MNIFRAFDGILPEILNQSALPTALSQSAEKLKVPPSTLFYHWQLKQPQTFVQLIRKMVPQFCVNLRCLPCCRAELLKSPFAMWIQLLCAWFISFAHLEGTVQASSRRV